MDKNFWRDLYPTSETRRRFARTSWRWIYLPIAASALVAVGIAAAVLVSTPGGGFPQSGQLATIVLAGMLLAAGFFAWLVILACLWGLNDVLEILPVFTSRARLRVVIGARAWKRRISGIKRIAAAVFRFFSPGKRSGPFPWEKMKRTGRRGGHSNG